MIVSFASAHKGSSSSPCGQPDPSMGNMGDSGESSGLVGVRKGDDSPLLYLLSVLGSRFGDNGSGRCEALASTFPELAPVYPGVVVIEPIPLSTSYRSSSSLSCIASLVGMVILDDKAVLGGSVGMSRGEPRRRPPNVGCDMLMVIGRIEDERQRGQTWADLERRKTQSEGPYMLAFKALSAWHELISSLCRLPSGQRIS